MSNSHHIINLVSTTDLQEHLTTLQDPTPVAVSHSYVLEMMQELLKIQWSILLGKVSGKLSNPYQQTSSITTELHSHHWL